MTVAADELTVANDGVHHCRCGEICLAASHWLSVWRDLRVICAPALCGNLLCKVGFPAVRFKLAFKLAFLQHVFFRDRHK
mgnify:CR=1 FL=1